MKEARDERPHGVIPLIQNAQNRYIHRDRKLISLVPRAGAGRKGSGKTTDGDEVVDVSTGVAETLIRLCDCPKNH